MIPKRPISMLAACALISAIGLRAEAMPQGAGQALLAKVGPVHLTYSPLPSKFRQGLDLVLVRDVRQSGGSGGGCWNHCYNSYDECLGISSKPICLSQIKMCMETCDKLTGLTNPVRRANDNQ